MQSKSSANVVTHRTREEWWHGIAHLLVTMPLRRMKEIPIRERLKTSAFTRSQDSIFEWVDWSRRRS